MCAENPPIYHLHYVTLRMASSSSSTVNAKASTSTRASIKTMSLVELRAAAAAESSEVKILSVTTVTPSLSFPMFQPTGSDLTPKEVFDRLTAKRGEAVLMIPHQSLALPFARSKTFTANQAPILHKADIEMWRRCKNSNIAMISASADVATQLVRSNGTRQGVVKRMTERMIGSIHSKKFRPPISEVVKHFFVDWERIVAHDKDVEAGKAKGRLISSSITEESYVMQRLNINADAGMPYAFEYSGKQETAKVGGPKGFTNLQQQWWDPATATKQKKDVPLSGTRVLIADHAMVTANRMLREICDQEIPRMAQEMENWRVHVPELFTALLKRKDEKEERENFWKKVRPYFVYPLPTRILMMHALNPVEFGLVNYLENFESGCAYHFSPFYGAAKRHLEYVKYHYDISKQVKNNGFHFAGLFYGDDQKWFFFFPDGFVVIGPDVESMDMRTSDRCVGPLTTWGLSQFDGKMSDAQLNAMLMTFMMAFNVNVHVGGPYIATKTHGNGSGTPGTTTINNLNSAHLQEGVRGLFGDMVRKQQVKTVADFPKVLNAIRNYAKDVFDYNFKGIAFETDGKYIGTLPWYTFVNYGEYVVKGDPCAFLGTVLVCRGGKHYFVPEDISKFVPSLVLPGGYDKPTKYTLERILGVFISGGWFLPEMNAFLRETFDAVRKSTVQNGVMTDVDDVSVGAEDAEELVSFMAAKNERGLPRDDVMEAFHQDSKEEFFNKFNTSRLTKATDEDEHPAPASSSASSSSTASGGTEVAETTQNQVLAAYTAWKSGALSVPAASAGHGNANNKVDEELRKQRVEENARRRQRKLEAMYVRIDAQTNRVIMRKNRGMSAPDDEDDQVNRVARSRRTEAHNSDTEYLKEEEEAERSFKEMSGPYRDDLDTAEDEDQIRTKAAKRKQALKEEADSWYNT